MITGIDHIAIQVLDLESAIANYEVIFGRSCNWRGGATGMKHAWFQFDNAALDIIAPDGDSEAAKAIRADIAKWGEGIMGVGFAVSDLDEAVKLYERRGLAFVPRHTTMTESPTGEQRRWDIAMMRRKSANGVALFLVEQKQGAARWPVSPQTGDAPVTNLDHVVVQTPNADRALVTYGARLGLDLRLDRANEHWGARQLFFRCGGAVVEVGASLKAPVSDGVDTFGGLAWRVKEPEAAQARIAAAGIDVSEVRKGRKPGTSVFTVRKGTGNVPTLMLSGND